MPKKTISVRVPPDTHERFEEYRAENSPEGNELSKADAGRRLLERGLDLEEGRLEADGGDGGTSGWDVARWLALSFAVAGGLVGVALFSLAPALPSPLAWRVGGVVVVGFGLFATAVTVGLSVAELVVQVWRHGAEIDEAVREIVRLPRRRAD